MFATSTILKIGKKEINCKDFTFGYMLGIEDGSIKDTLLNAVLNGSNLTEEEVKGLRKSEVELIYTTILKLTYPTLYDEDGNLKQLPEQADDGDKKKA